MARELGHPVAEEDLESHIAPNTLEQLKNINGEFFIQFQEFKKQLQKEVSLVFCFIFFAF